MLRAGLLYIAAVWALSQGISQLSPDFGLPNAVTRWFVIACAIGFPFWLAFAWFYEFTPQGFRRDHELAPDAPQRLLNARLLGIAIIGVLVIAVALLGWRVLVLDHASVSASAQTTQTTSSGPSDDTLVVLPFQNLSNDPRQQYFSDGITEELTNALGQNAALRVIAWDTASHYRDSKQTATAIGKALDVANVLTGKILRQGDAVRVIVELVNTRTGYQVWSNHYDDSLANVFAVQDKITQAIAGALKVKLASLGSAPTVNPQAHDLVLKARALMERARTAAPIEQARKLFEQAVVLDPDYADAHAGLAGAWFDLTQYSTLPLKDALPKTREEAHKALALDPRSVTALVELANADAVEGRIAEAKVEYERAIAIDPSNAAAHLDYGNMLSLKQGLAQEMEAAQLDPDNTTAQNNLATIEVDLGEYAQAVTPWRATLRLDPHSADNAMELALTNALLHRDRDAVKAFDLAVPKTPLARALVAAGRLTYQSLLDPKLHAQALNAVESLDRRTDLDPTSMGDVAQLYLALGENASAMGLLPKVCAATPIGCNDLGINPEYLPLRGDPRFQQLVRKYDTVSKPQAFTEPAPAPASP